jgi:effector-binding domain-containing protein
METQPAPRIETQLTDVVGLRACGIFPKSKEPSIRTLRNWTNLRRIPHHRVGHFIYYDPAEVALHIRSKLKVPARG